MAEPGKPGFWDPKKVMFDRQPDSVSKIEDTQRLLSSLFEGPYACTRAHVFEAVLV